MGPTPRSINKAVKEAPTNANPEQSRGTKERRKRDRGTYSGADSAELRAAIVAVTNAGAAVLFSRTADGGALSILILDGAKKERWYPHGDDELGDALREIAEMYWVAGEDTPGDKLG